MTVSKHDKQETDSHFFVEKYLGHFCLKSKQSGQFVTQGDVQLGVISLNIKARQSYAASNCCMAIVPAIKCKEEKVICNVMIDFVD